MFSRWIQRGHGNQGCWLYVILLFITYSLYGERFESEEPCMDLENLPSFKIKDELLKGQIHKYRKSMMRVSDLEYSSSHWEKQIAIYMNKSSNTYIENHLTFLEEKQEEDDEIEFTYEPYSEGTLFIKENFYDKKTEEGVIIEPYSLTFMIKKQPGFDTEYGDWEYLEVNKEGDVILQGGSGNAAVMESCVECHENVSHQDFIFTTFLRHDLRLSKKKNGAQDSRK